MWVTSKRGYADPGGMTTDDKPERDDPAVASSSGPDEPSENQEWLAGSGDWLDREPETRHVRAAFVELCRRGSAKEIVTALEAIWSLLDRAALWVSSIQTDLAANSSGLVDGTCAALMPTISRQMRTLTYLGRSGVDYLPTAMAAGRAAFEVGLRLEWINRPEDHEERKIRVLRLHNDQTRWKNAVARDYDRSSAGGDRWLRAAQVQAALVARELRNINWTGQLQQPPSVSAQLHELDLDRLYSGYRLASEYVHGGLSSALDAEAVRTERSPFGIYWPNDWSLAVLMCAWGCRFSTRHYAGRGFNLGPLRGSMLAAELMLLSPGPGWRHNE
jgi:hypothetical protein